MLSYQKPDPDPTKGHQQAAPCISSRTQFLQVLRQESTFRNDSREETGGDSLLLVVHSASVSFQLNDIQSLSPAFPRLIYEKGKGKAPLKESFALAQVFMYSL